jgi:hypothetical protein
MRLQRRHSAAPAVPAVAPGATVPWRLPSPSTRRGHPRVIASALRAAVPHEPTSPARTSSTIAAATLAPQGACPSGSSSAPPLRWPPRPVPIAGGGFAAYISDTPRKGEPEGVARRLVGVERAAPSRPLVPPRRGCGRRAGTAAHSLRSPGYGRDPPPGMIRDWGTDRVGWSGRRSVDAPGWDGPAAPRLMCGWQQ